jgi:hypothetical protein
MVLLAHSEPTFLLSWTTPVFLTPSTPVTITAGESRSTTSHPQGDVLTLTRRTDSIPLLGRSFGFPNAPEVYTGTDAQKDKLKRSFDRKIQYMKKIGGPIWSACPFPLPLCDESVKDEWLIEPS